MECYDIGDSLHGYRIRAIGQEDWANGVVRHEHKKNEEEIPITERQYPGL